MVYMMIHCNCSPGYSPEQEAHVLPVRPQCVALAHWIQDREAIRLVGGSNSGGGAGRRRRDEAREGDPWWYGGAGGTHLRDGCCSGSRRRLLGDRVDPVARDDHLRGTRGIRGMVGAARASERDQKGHSVRPAR